MSFRYFKKREHDHFHSYSWIIYSYVILYRDKDQSYEFNNQSKPDTYRMLHTGFISYILSFSVIKQIRSTVSDKYSNDIYRFVFISTKI